MKERLKKIKFIYVPLHFMGETKLRLEHLKYKKYADSSRIKEFKNIENGKRCFIVANGPSLTIEDLELIKDEDCFAMNRIFKIFDQTEWRPKYYCSQDVKLLEELKEDFSDLFSEIKYGFLNSEVVSKNKELLEQYDNLVPFYLDLCPFIDKKKPLFSSDISQKIYEGCTVTYACIQLAVYMGYSEIYILGVDHSYSVSVDKDGNVIQDKNAQNYMKGLEGSMSNVPLLDKSTLAYMKARKYCEQNSIKIYNATRGGKLEVFNRIKLEDLF